MNAPRIVLALFLVLPLSAAAATAHAQQCGPEVVDVDIGAAYTWTDNNTTSGKTDDFEMSCDTNCGDVLYRWISPAYGESTFTFSTLGGDQNFSVGTSCGSNNGPEDLYCSGSNNGSVTIQNLFPGAELFVAAQAYYDDDFFGSGCDPGDYRIQMTHSCGNGTVESNEECDGGAQNSNTTPNACRSYCANPWCGDGVVDDGEVCDDGAMNGTGFGLCNEGCLGVNTCGDGIQDPLEECDDGSFNGFGEGFCTKRCDGTQTCGNGVTEGTEVCDDGAANGDEGRCSADCSDLPLQLLTCPTGAQPFGDAFLTSTCAGANTAGDDCSVSLSSAAIASAFPAGFRYLGTRYTDSIFVSTNGNITFGGAYTAWVPQGVCDGSVPAGGIIAPHFTDADIGSGGGTVNVCVVPDSGTAATPNDDGKLIITWADVCAFNEDCSERNTFQLVLESAGRICDGSSYISFWWEDIGFISTSSQSTASIGFGNGQVCISDPCDLQSCSLDVDDRAIPGRRYLVGDTLVECGDGNVEGNCEECDDGNTVTETCTTWSLEPTTVDICNGDCLNAVAVCPFCGDGNVESGSETCDDGSNNGRPGFCNNNCSGIVTECGNNTAAGSEVCDGSDLAGETCVSQGFDSGTLTCNDSCSGFVTDNCYFCGDGKVEGGELCDSNATGAATCVTEGFTGGVLRCNATCDGYDTGACFACGNGTVDGAEACDGSDLGGSDCTSLGYSNPGGAACASDCTVDFDGCAAVCGDGNAEPGEECDEGSQTATCDADCTLIACGDGICNELAGENGNNCPQDCDSSCGNSIVEDPEECDGLNFNGETCQTLGFDTGTLVCSDFCTVNRDSCQHVCGDAEVDPGEACDDGNITNGDGCSATCGVEPGWECDSDGDPSICDAICGDGLVRGDETCDDGGVSPGDGCSATCEVEDGWICVGEASECTGLCGDGMIRGDEACDDNNNANGDGCNANCAVEPGWTCSGEASECDAICGDGLIRGDEACDDNNTIPGDGCSDLCVVDDNYSCTGEPSVCTPGVVCGDGARGGGEACDDGNTANGDGCDAICEVEDGWSCSSDTGGASVCEPTCGDGRIIGDEACDDGNLSDGDGCDAACTVEDGWGCVGEASTCSPSCGDGLIRGDESCDDGNTSIGDGCSASCDVETGWSCDDEPSVCVMLQSCGDGAITGAEACDDGNTNSGDGCNAACQVEDGWECVDEPSICTEVDSDGDGCSDVRELSDGTDPNNPDSDGDDLGDCDEPTFGTDPNNPDSDSDGIRDGTEVYGENPTNPADPDTDDDGYCDGVLIVPAICGLGGEDTNNNGRIDRGETDPNDPNDPGDSTQRVVGGALLGCASVRPTPQGSILLTLVLGAGLLRRRRR